MGKRACRGRREKELSSDARGVGRDAERGGERKGGVATDKRTGATPRLPLAATEIRESEFRSVRHVSQTRLDRGDSSCRLRHHGDTALSFPPSAKKA